MTHYFLLLACVISNCLGQIFLKLGVDLFGKELRIIDFGSLYIIFGVTVYALSLILWLIVLRNIPFTIAFSSMALNFIFMPIIANKLFGEPYNLLIALGSVLIISGIVLIGVNLMRAI